MASKISAITLNLLYPRVPVVLRGFIGISRECLVLRVFRLKPLWYGYRQKCFDYIRVRQMHLKRLKKHILKFQIWIFYNSEMVNFNKFNMSWLDNSIDTIFWRPRYL